MRDESVRQNLRGNGRRLAVFFGMSVLLLLGYFLWGCASIGCSPDGGTEHPRVEITIGSLNAFLFWDMTCDSGTCNGTWEKKPTSEEFQEKISRLKEDIELLNPEVLLLQEVESEHALQALRDALPSYPYGAIAKSERVASINTAILSKLPLHNVKTHKITTIYAPGARLVLESRVIKQGKEVILFSVHLQSKRSDKTGAIRKNQARNLSYLMELTSDENPEALVVSAGDFNDSPESAALYTLSQHKLIRRALAMPGEWTYDYHGSRQSLDQLYYVQREGVELLEPLYVLHNLSGSDHAAIRGIFRF